MANDEWLIFRPESFGKGFFQQETTVANDGIVVDLPNKEQEWLYKKELPDKDKQKNHKQSGIVGWISWPNNDIENEFDENDKHNKLDSIYLVNDDEYLTLSSTKLTSLETTKEQIKTKTNSLLTTNIITNDFNLTNQKDNKSQIILPINPVTFKPVEIMQNDAISTHFNQSNMTLPSFDITTLSLTLMETITVTSTITELPPPIQPNVVYSGVNYSQPCNPFYSTLTATNPCPFELNALVQQKTKILPLKNTSLEQNKTIDIMHVNISANAQNLTSIVYNNNETLNCCNDEWNIFPINSVNKLPFHNLLSPIIPINDQYEKEITNFELQNVSKNKENVNLKSFFITSVKLPTIESMPNSNFTNEVKVDEGNNSVFIPWYKPKKITLQPLLTLKKTTANDFIMNISSTLVFKNNFTTLQESKLFFT